MPIPLRQPIGAFSRLVSTADVNFARRRHGHQRRGQRDLLGAGQPEGRLGDFGGRAVDRRRAFPVGRVPLNTDCRAKPGLTQTQLAEATGLSQARISQIENGDAVGLDMLRAYVVGLDGHLDIVARIGNFQFNVAWSNPHAYVIIIGSSTPVTWPWGPEPPANGGGIRIRVRAETTRRRVRRGSCALGHRRRMALRPAAESFRPGRARGRTRRSGRGRAAPACAGWRPHGF